jgi:hypothetical protein
VGCIGLRASQLVKCGGRGGVIPPTYLDILDQVGGAVGHFLGCLDKVPLGHRVSRLAAGNLASVAQHTGVLGDDCGSG